MSPPTQNQSKVKCRLLNYAINNTNFETTTMSSFSVMCDAFDTIYTSSDSKSFYITLTSS
eukprot:m.3720 g.3720  ORF g.3720 m.3720 type:complete len:60 (+) comp2628_c0_seq1:964-1143(+)